MTPRAASLLAAVAIATAAGLARGDDTSAAVRAIVESGVHPRLNRADFSKFRPQMVELYEGRDFEPLWLRDGAPSPQATELIGKLLGAGDNGLLPGDYDARWLDSERQREQRTPQANAELDTGLTLSVMRYMSDSYLGRVDPRDAGFQFDRPEKQLDLVRTIRAMEFSPSPSTQLDELAPPFPAYRRLAAALARLRLMAADTALPEIPDMPSLHPGERNPGVPAVRESLTLLGYREPTAAAADPELYDEELSAAMARFQQRHGLDSDGIIGRQTLRQLRVPLSWRVRQIELAMERLRWLPYELSGRFIVVNIPEFRLRGFSTRDGPPEFTSGVVVGTAAEKTRTPVLTGTMSYLIFRPYWNVPSGITRGELLPSIRRDPRYLGKHHYEIVGTGGNSGLLAPDADGVSALASGGARLRQRPGADNALGLVKFIFPNPSNVYLHDTPAKALFRRSRRDFSHGCIRVEDPLGLARWLLAPQWDDRRIREAMVGDDNKRVNLPAPVQVFLYYSTAVVDEEGQIFFFDDIYGHDNRLAHLLAME